MPMTPAGPEILDDEMSSPALNQGQGNAGMQGAHAPAAPDAPQRPQVSASEHSQGEQAVSFAGENPNQGPSQTHTAEDYERLFHEAAQENQSDTDGDDKQVQDENTQALKQQVLQVLHAVKQQAPILEQLQQQAPDAYAAVVGCIQTMTGLYRTLANEQGTTDPTRAGVESKPVKKNEDAVTYTHRESEEGERFPHFHVEAHLNGQRIGHARFKPKTKNRMYAVDLYVSPEHRRKGIATKMYDHAEQHSGRRIDPSHDQTTDGKAFSRARKLHKSDDGQRKNRIDAAHHEPNRLLPNVHTIIPAERMANIPYKKGQSHVTIHRAIRNVGKDSDATIRPGDWVALSKEYAHLHGGDDPNTKLVSMKVPAHHVMWAGTDENEWFYTPNDKPVTKSDDDQHDCGCEECPLGADNGHTHCRPCEDLGCEPGKPCLDPTNYVYDNSRSYGSSIIGPRGGMKKMPRTSTKY